MKISLDYDKTFTADRAMFREIVKIIKAYGHEVKIVTLRHEEVYKNHPYGIYTNDDILEDALNEEIPLIFTNGGQKADFYDADIFIDDLPHLCPTFEQLSLHLHRLITE